MESYGRFVSYLKVRASVTRVNDTVVVEEGKSVTLFCDVTGTPSLNVFWINSNSNELMKAGVTWTLPSISRNYSGEYKCIASNTCGNDSKTTVNDVQCESLFIY